MGPTGTSWASNDTSIERGMFPVGATCVTVKFFISTRSELRGRGVCVPSASVSILQVSGGVQNAFVASSANIYFSFVLYERESVLEVSPSAGIVICPCVEVTVSVIANCIFERINAISLSVAMLFESFSAPVKNG